MNATAVESVKVLAGTAASFATGLVSDQTAMDIGVAVMGGFVAMAPGETVKQKLWEGMIGIALGCGLASVLRSYGLDDGPVRASAFLAAILSTKAVFWIHNPADGAAAIKSLLGVVQKVLAALSGRQ